MISEISDVVLMPDGRIILTHDATPHEALVFAVNGRFVQQIGRAGKGPGEFTFARSLSVHGNKLHVFDPVQRRHSTFTAELRFLGSRPFEGHLLTRPLPLGDNLMAVNGLIRTRERAGFLIHLFDSTGAVIRSLANATGGYRADLSSEVYSRQLAHRRDGGIWAAHRTRYAIEHWDTTGTLRRAFRRTVPWFVDHLAGDGRLTPAKPKGTRLLDIQEDKDGLLWVMLRVAAPDWANALVRVERQATREDQGYQFTSLDRAYDTIIEIIDPRAAEVLVSARLEQAAPRFVGPQQIASYSEDAEGVSRVHIWRLVRAP